MASIELRGCRCERCGHEWVPKKSGSEPKVCPKCHSPYWNTPRRNGARQRGAA